MTWRLRVSRRAGAQIRTASTWWRSNRDKAPDAFTEDLEDAFRLIGDLPGAGEPVPHPEIPSLRRLLLACTRYHLYYSVDESAAAVDVLALWHTGRGEPPRVV